MSLPALRLLAGITMVAMPPESDAVEELYPPPERVTVPVGVAPEPVTVTFTLKLAARLVVPVAGATLTDAVSTVTVSEAVAFAVG